MNSSYHYSLAIMLERNAEMIHDEITATLVAVSVFLVSASSSAFLERLCPVLIPKRCSPNGATGSVLKTRTRMGVYALQ